MRYYGSETRLTDALERELVREAVLEQMEFKPVVALGGLLTKLSSIFRTSRNTKSHVPSSAPLAH